MIESYVTHEIFNHWTFYDYLGLILVAWYSKLFSTHTDILSNRFLSLIVYIAAIIIVFDKLLSFNCIQSFIEL